MKQDIQTRDDIVLLVDTFYQQVRADALLAPPFKKVIGDDWSQHLPVMYSFWEMILLQQPGYQGNPVQKHIQVDAAFPLSEAHFAQWLHLWEGTLNQLFSGAVADEALKRAKLMKQLISLKITDSHKRGFIQ